MGFTRVSFNVVRCCLLLWLRRTLYHRRTATQSRDCLPHTKRRRCRTMVGLKIVFGEASKTGFFYSGKNFKNSVISY